MANCNKLFSDFNKVITPSNEQIVNEDFKRSTREEDGR